MAEEKKNTAPPSDKVFKSKLFAFPPEILAGIDEAISKGFKADKIRDYMRRNYGGALEIPNRKTIGEYIKKRSKTLEKSDKVIRIRRELSYTDEELKLMQMRLNVAGTDVTNLKGILEKMVALMLTRIQLTSQLQDNILDPRVEHNIIKQVGEVRVLVVKLMDLEGQLSRYEAVARFIVEKFLMELAPVVRKAAEDTYGTSKSKEFIERLQKGYKTIDFERVRNEATLEVANMEKEKTGVKKIGTNAV